MNITKDNKNTKQELLIELRVYINLIRQNEKQDEEVKLAMQCILLILQMI